MDDSYPKNPLEAEQYRLAGTLARLAHQRSPRDVRVFCDDALVYACYDSGRTLVLNTASHQGVGLIDTMQRVWRAAKQARRARKSAENA